MKKCLDCGTSFLRSRTDCPSCGSTIELIEGFPAYAPAFAKESGGFKAAYFSELVELEADHFWFRARNRLILWAIKKYCPEFRSFLEIGCGTGYVLSAIAENYPSAQLYGSEIFTAGLKFAALRQPKIQFMQMDARNIPFVGEFEAIGAFDVIEHIKEDEKVLTDIHSALVPGGIMLLTVPQHDWLWSAHDDYACHERRYSARELHSKVKDAGFEILRSTSFVSSLLPAMLVSRMARKSTSAKELDATAEFKISPFLNTLFEKILNVEIALIRRGFSLSMGGSRLIVARKKK